ncbi:hypothetical protein ACXOJI_09175 [Streptococcus thermophilus]
MKIFNWIFSNKQTLEVEAFEVEPYRMVDEKIREFNADHGLPLDQIIAR